MPQLRITTDDFRVEGKARLGRMPANGIDKAAAEARVEDLQRELAIIQQAYLGTSERAVVVLEGWDAAGKGGTVRRIAWALDPRSFRVYPIGAPSAAEKAQHYLQRFWQRLPAHGEIVVFDRSWYGRVLVERVEEFASKSQWSRAYGEINAFEKTLADDGARLVKIFLDITPDEQLKRFEDRLADPVKRWKLTYEDFRNRDRWGEYEAAIVDMMAETSTKAAPWYLVPSNSKTFGRLVTLEILVEVLGKGIARTPKSIPERLVAEATKEFGEKFVAKHLKGSNISKS